MVVHYLPKLTTMASLPPTALPDADLVLGSTPNAEPATVR
jgi:hypothetical protein